MPGPLHLRHIGEGPTRVLALHCGLGQGAMWRGVAQALAPEVTVTAPDLPGHGRSAPFPEDGDVHDLATGAVGALLDAPMHLWGHSFGATVALRLALERPDLVRSLTLVEPVFFAAAPEGPIRTAHRICEEEIFAEAAPMLCARRFNRFWGGGVPWDSLRAEVQEAMAQQMGFVRRTEPSLWGDGADLLAPGRLEALNAPVALLRGAQSLPIVAEIHRGLLSRLPDAREIEVPDAGHMLVMTHPAAVAGAARDMMQTSPA